MLLDSKNGIKEDNDKLFEIANSIKDRDLDNPEHERWYILAMTRGRTSQYKKNKNIPTNFQLFQK